MGKDTSIVCVTIIRPHISVLYFVNGGFSIGGLPETQEMLDYCAGHNITSDVEIIDIAYINEAYERMLKGNVKFVL